VITRAEQATGTGTGQGVASGTLTPPVAFPNEFGAEPQPGQGAGTGGGGGGGTQPQRPPRVKFELRDADGDRDQRERQILEKLSETGIGGAEDFAEFEETVLETDDPLGEVLGDDGGNQ